LGGRCDKLRAVVRLFLKDEGTAHDCKKEVLPLRVNPEHLFLKGMPYFLTTILCCK
jgi:hypothetical protein